MHTYIHTNLSQELVQEAVRHLQQHAAEPGGLPSRAALPVRGGHGPGRAGVHHRQPHLPEQDKGLHQPPEEVSHCVQSRPLPHRRGGPETGLMAAIFPLSYIINSQIRFVFRFSTWKNVLFFCAYIYTYNGISITEFMENISTTRSTNIIHEFKI